jgi:hypothetical protein
MADRTVKAVLQDAASGDWSIPEFQREFEWKHEQVAVLCNSLLKDLPIGIVTVWSTTNYNEPQMLPVSGRIPLWIVDGQQRITSLCILAGRKPYWMDNSEWNDAFKKRIFLNIELNGKASIGRPLGKARAKIPIDEIIHKDPGEAQRYVQGKCTEFGILQSQESSDLAVKALGILGRAIPVAEVGEDKAVEDIAELYRRLNQQGTRLRQPQIMLSWVSQYDKGWVREKFYPYLEKLRNKDGWELDPAHVLQVATILAEGKARVGLATIPDMWQSKIQQIWSNLKQAIDVSILCLWDKGITDVDMVPSSYTLIVLFAIQAKFMEKPGYNFDRLFKWFVIANLSGRYSDAPLEKLTSDANELYNSTSFAGILRKLPIDWTKDELRESVRQKFRDNSSQALLLHVLLWSTGAKDLLQDLSIPALTQASQGLEPHWHHIVPQAWGEANGFTRCDVTANVTRICGKTNKQSALKSKPPWVYVPELNISEDALVQHLIPQEYAQKFVRGQTMSPSEFNAFLEEREGLIVQRGASILGI